MSAFGISGGLLILEEPPVTGYEAGDMGRRSRTSLEAAYLRRAQAEFLSEGPAEVHHLRVVEPD